MDTLADLVLNALKFIFPAYCANAAPVLFGGGFPLDFGKNFYDGKPIFGKNKTFKGFFSGLAIGTTVGAVESIFFGYPIHLGFLLALGALVGDLAGAFLKRRIGIPPGETLPIVDQIDFAVGALIFSSPLNMLFPELVITVLAITPPLHMLTNFAAYKMGLKKKPW
ncbi:MAG: CDP-2,3-bis-(O-geranylgeranyl)-sn-glycerol synthase [Candidatus Bathyarchaeia archaeon]|nr:CDP-2,3-bis-(O-geranylgeranyl)-sn-glycerol synthase [Candidatus Bathyarchaeota archaeon]